MKSNLRCPDCNQFMMVRNAGAGQPDYECECGTMIFGPVSKEPTAEELADAYERETGFRPFERSHRKQKKNTQQSIHFTGHPYTTSLAIRTPNAKSEEKANLLSTSKAK